MKRFNNNFRSVAATIFGLLTSIATAMTVLDIDALDWSKPTTYLKMFVVVMPAIGGFLSEVKQTPTDSN